MPANATVDTVIGGFVHGLPGSAFHTRQWNHHNVTAKTYAAGQDTSNLEHTVCCMRGGVNS